MVSLRGRGFQDNQRRGGIPSRMRATSPVKVVQSPSQGMQTPTLMRQSRCCTDTRDLSNESAWDGFFDVGGA